MQLDDALALLLFALGAFLIPIGSGRIGLPAAVGEIIYGVLIGPQVANLVERNTFTSFLAELGFVVLMFLAGLEIDFARMARSGKRRLLLGVAAAIAIFVLAAGWTLALGLPFFLFLVFGAMSVGILLATLADAGMTRSRAGQAIIFVGSVGELITIVLLTGLGLYFAHGLGLPLLLHLAKLAAIFAAAYFVLVLLRTLVWWLPHVFARLTAKRDPAEMGVRAGMALMFVFVALAALLGIEAILGAFIAGAIWSFVLRGKGALETKLSSIGFGFFVPFFFIGVGADFDLSLIKTETFATVGLFLLASVTAKLGAALLLIPAGLRPREAIGAGLLLAAPLTLLVAISRIGLSLDLFDAQAAAAIVLLALVSSVVWPWLFRLLVPAHPATRDPEDVERARHGRGVW